MGWPLAVMVLSGVALGWATARLVDETQVGLIVGLIGLAFSLNALLRPALAGREHILNAYKIAVENRYRFFSFGDAMFIADGLDAGGAE